MTDLEHQIEGIRVEYVGEEQVPVAVFDGFSPHPDLLVDDAAALAFSPRGPHYPGIRAACDPAHLQSMSTALQEVITTVFGFSKGVRLVECNFSLVTTRRERLTQIQRLPHFDSVSPGRLALLHYLCGADHGGTAFYRHRATGYETITQDRLSGYTEALRSDLAQMGPPPLKYVSNSTPIHDQTAAFEASHNRALLYPGHVLHSGQIPQDFLFSNDPRAGRLTINTFFEART